MQMCKPALQAARDCGAPLSFMLRSLFTMMEKQQVEICDSPIEATSYKPTSDNDTTYYSFCLIASVESQELTSTPGSASVLLLSSMFHWSQDRRYALLSLAFTSSSSLRGIDQLSLKTIAI